MAAYKVRRRVTLLSMSSLLDYMRRSLKCTVQHTLHGHVDIISDNEDCNVRKIMVMIL